MCRSRRELSNEYLLAKIGVDTAENEPLEVWGKLIQYYSFVSLLRSRRAAVYGRAELRALKRGHLGACSVRRNWYRSLGFPWCGVKASEGFGRLRKVAAFWKNPKNIWLKFSKNSANSYWQNLRFFGKISKIIIIISANVNEKIETREWCKGAHSVDLGESFPTSI